MDNDTKLNELVEKCAAFAWQKGDKTLSSYAFTCKQLTDHERTAVVGMAYERFEQESKFFQKG